MNILTWALALEFFLVGVGLAMDAFAVSVCKGLGMTKVNKKQTFIIALFFGGFQALMPFLGWLLGSRFEKFVKAFAPWVGFILLLFLGGKMIIEAVKNKEDDKVEEKDKKLDMKELLVMAIATSIDALAVGISFGLLYPRIGTILVAIATIGVTTFLISFAGVFIGNVFGTRFEKRAQIAGGIILILIGVKIILEGLDILKL
ncbi:MAG: manganese efflux pump MntP family protein [Lachnospiraceae bacterium]|nr:manganese efflux pump MntP family protein [Lachnospiraceae bacterium]